MPHPSPRDGFTACLRGLSSLPDGPLIQTETDQCSLPPPYTSQAAAACTSLTSTAPSKANPSTAALSLPSPKPTPIYPSRSVAASAAQRPSNTTSRPGFNTSSSAPKPLKNHSSSLTCANNSPVTS